MQRSTHRILTTRCGSLPCLNDLLEMLTAGVDCSFATLAGAPTVVAMVAWAKLGALGLCSTGIETFYHNTSCRRRSFPGLAKTGVYHQLASDDQVTGINYSDPLGVSGQLDSPLTFLFALDDAIQAYGPIRRIDIDSRRTHERVGQQVRLHLGGDGGIIGGFTNALTPGHG
jgi:hypothetical protein